MKDTDEIRALREDLQRRGTRRPQPKRIVEVVNDLLARRGYAQLQASSDQQVTWNEAVGERLAKDSRPGNLRRGVLEVIVRNSLLVQELTFQKNQLLKKLAGQNGGPAIRDLRFRVGVID